MSAERSFVFLLFTSRQPSHIARLVVPVIVLAVERRTCGAWSQLQVEQLKAREQKLDASPAIILPVWVVWNSATGLCIRVSDVFNCAEHTVFDSHALSLPQRHFKLKY